MFRQLIVFKFVVFPNTDLSDLLGQLNNKHALIFKLHYQKYYHLI